MRKLSFVAIACAILAGCGTDRPAQTAAPRNLKVLMIGNSFSICVLGQLPQCASSAGLGLDLCSLYIGGCPLSLHWKNVVASTNAAFRPYRVDWNYGGTKQDPSAPVARVAKATVDGKRTNWSANIPEMLSADRWDIVTIQQASSESWQPKTYEPYGSQLIDCIRRLAPQAEIVVQETWSYSPFDTRLKKWNLTQESMYANVKTAYALFAKDHGLRVIPTGAAVHHFRHAMPSPDGVKGEVCRSNPKGGDNCHLNGEGVYLQACTWFAALYGRPASSLAYRPDKVSEERAVQMRKSADVAVGFAN